MAWHQPTCPPPTSTCFPPPQVRKRYVALAWGRLRGEGVLRYTLDGRQCETQYSVLEHLELPDAPPGGAEEDGRPQDATPAPVLGGAEEHGPGDAFPAPGGAGGGWVTRVALWPHTGRTHQLRRHMALAGFPLVGDPRYTFG